jgi:glycosyltransferase involved in cell wall biosynthesis
VIAEAMAMGKAVVATAGGGPRELIRDGDSGCLVPLNDADALAQRIVDCLSDPTLVHRLGQRAHQDATARFGADTHAAHMQRVYARLVGRTPSGDPNSPVDVGVPGGPQRERQPPQSTSGH